MKRLLLIPALLLSLAATALAAQKTITLSVPGMYCAVCPVTVKKALDKAPGVSRVAVNFDKKEAVVVYDDAKTTIKSLAKVTEQAGYPSKPIGPTKGVSK
ncbi:MAG: mercury resistance system periplasmic binding protein MerP [Hydrogenophilaceae bacterium]|nr:mercury resistance system periplasmic binding protein MerP [Hydrogenophilaceae bacterium]